MHRRESEQLGICHKLFNMIMNTLIARGIKRLTTGPTTVHSGDSIEVPLEGLAKNGPLQVSVEMDHANGLENWVSFENLDSHVQEKEALIPRVDDDHLVKGGSDHKIVENNKDRSKDKDKMPIIYDQENSESQARNSRRGLSINGGEENQKVSEKNKNENKIGMDKTNGPPRTMWHLFSVDEKSDEFIRKKKEAMRKNYSFDHPR